jgi:hypothetical protein
VQAAPSGAACRFTFRFPVGTAELEIGKIAFR